MLIIYYIRYNNIMDKKSTHTDVLLCYFRYFYPPNIFFKKIFKKICKTQTVYRTFAPDFEKQV